MYTAADALEIGEAHELIASDMKPDPWITDDLDPGSMPCEEPFDSGD